MQNQQHDMITQWRPHADNIERHLADIKRSTNHSFKLFHILASDLLLAGFFKYEALLLCNTKCFWYFSCGFLTDADFKLHRCVHLTDHGGVEEGSMELVLPSTHELLQDENTWKFINSSMSLFMYYIISFHIKEQIMYNVYLISISYIYLPYFILLYI